MATTSVPPGDVPQPILDYARRQVRCADVSRAWVLYSQGAMSVAETARRLDLSPHTVGRWIRGCKAAIGASETTATDKKTDTPVTIAAITPSFVVQERAKLYKEASQRDKLELRQKILDSESRRLGMEVQRVEQTSLTIQIQAMPPEQRRAELATRLQRMAATGRVDVAALLPAHTETSATGGSTPGGAPTPLLDTPNIHSTISNEDANATTAQGGGMVGDKANATARYGDVMGVEKVERLNAGDEGMSRSFQKRMYPERHGHGAEPEPVAPDEPQVRLEEEPEVEVESDDSSLEEVLADGDSGSDED